MRVLCIYQLHYVSIWETLKGGRSKNLEIEVIFSKIMICSENIGHWKEVKQLVRIPVYIAEFFCLGEILQASILNRRRAPNATILNLGGAEQ